MGLFAFKLNDQSLRLGAALPGTDRLIDLHAADPVLPSNLLSFIRAGKCCFARARKLLKRSAVANPTYAPTAVRLLAPIPRPGKILCSGINYRSHQEENPGATLPDELFFRKDAFYGRARRRTSGDHCRHSGWCQPIWRSWYHLGRHDRSVFMRLMKNVLIISRFSSEWQGIVLGAVLVAAVPIDSLMNRKRVG